MPEIAKHNEHYNEAVEKARDKFLALGLVRDVSEFEQEPKKYQELSFQYHKLWLNFCYKNSKRLIGLSAQLRLDGASTIRAAEEAQIILKKEFEHELLEKTKNKSFEEIWKEEKDLKSENGQYLRPIYNHHALIARIPEKSKKGRVKAFKTDEKKSETLLKEKTQQTANFKQEIQESTLQVASLKQNLLQETSLKQDTKEEIISRILLNIKEHHLAVLRQKEQSVVKTEQTLAQEQEPAREKAEETVFIKENNEACPAGDLSSVSEPLKKADVQHIDTTEDKKEDKGILPVPEKPRKERYRTFKKGFRRLKALFKKKTLQIKSRKQKKEIISNILKNIKAYRQEVLRRKKEQLLAKSEVVLHKGRRSFRLAAIILPFIGLGYSQYLRTSNAKPYAEGPVKDGKNIVLTPSKPNKMALDAKKQNKDDKKILAYTPKIFTTSQFEPKAIEIKKQNTQREIKKPDKDDKKILAYSPKTFTISQFEPKAIEVKKQNPQEQIKKQEPAKQERTAVTTSDDITAIRQKIKFTLSDLFNDDILSFAPQKTPAAKPDVSVDDFKAYERRVLSQKDKDMAEFCTLYRKCAYDNYIKLECGNRRKTFKEANIALKHYGFSKISQGLHCSGMSMASLCQAADIFIAKKPQSPVSLAIKDILKNCHNVHSCLALKNDLASQTGLVKYSPHIETDIKQYMQGKKNAIVFVWTKRTKKKFHHQTFFAAPEGTNQAYIYCAYNNQHWGGEQTFSRYMRSRSRYGNSAYFTDIGESINQLALGYAKKDIALYKEKRKNNNDNLWAYVPDFGQTAALIRQSIFTR